MSALGANYQSCPRGSAWCVASEGSWGGGRDYNSAPCWSKANKSDLINKVEKTQRSQKKIVVVVNGVRDNVLVQNHL